MPYLFTIMVGEQDGMNGLKKSLRELQFSELIQFKTQSQTTYLHIQIFYQNYPLKQLKDSLMLSIVSQAQLTKLAIYFVKHWL